MRWHACALWPSRSVLTDHCWTQAKLLCRPLGVPSAFRHWQQRHHAQRWAGCADLPAVRSTHVRTVPIRAMSTTASPPKAKSQKTKNRDKNKDDSTSTLTYPAYDPSRVPVSFFCMQVLTRTLSTFHRRASTCAPTLCSVSHKYRTFGGITRCMKAVCRMRQR